ncbi:Shedu anti-phage system protein SduA domain-containing protein [Flocculibacter collagenilyticus]|uniref:Shedu anti-phage system protein SduA domain-containing protein n=1 Tax=Flocculibacter collagenilyticus TaxID=2744479 RepID=UPI0018F6CEE7|nr:Shedu anti-phage system protein SduA domain-containing protein [Flocculibacter collagenilyticus]
MITIDKCVLTISSELQSEKKRIEDSRTKMLGGLPIFSYSSSDFPKEIRHYRTLFPNNWLDTTLLKDGDEIRSMCQEFQEYISSKKVKERDILKWIKDNRAYHLLGALISKKNFGHHDAFIFPEFQLGNSYKVDFLLVGKNSGGYQFLFVELESPVGRIFTKSDDLGDVHRKGLKQIDDWRKWLEQNYNSIHSTFKKYIKPNETLPAEFLTYDSTRFHYCVVAGRREDYEESNDARYRLRRDTEKKCNLNLYHFDNLIDFAESIIGNTTY